MNTHSTVLQSGDTHKFRGLFLLFCCICFINGCSPKESKTKELRQPSEKSDVRLIRLSKYNLEKSVKNMRKFNSEVSDNIEFIGAIPQPRDMVSDSPRFFLYKLANTDQYLVQETIGFTGAIKCRYGPFLIDERFPEKCVPIR